MHMQTLCRQSMITMLLMMTSSLLLIQPIQGNIGKGIGSLITAGSEALLGREGLLQAEQAPLLKTTKSSRSKSLRNKNAALSKKLLGAREVTFEKLAHLREYYGEDADLLLGSVHFWNRDYLKTKILNVILQEDEKETPFIIGFQGSSVTAGHDNYFNQSYPLVFHQELEEAFAHAGVKLIVRNFAMGNNPPIPAAFCVANQLGTDIDVAAWEFGMMIGNWKPYWIELWMRNAAHLPKQPVMMFLDPGEGARKPDNEGKLPTENRQDPPEPFLLWQMPNLLEHYIENAPHVQSMKEAVWNLDANPRYNFNALVGLDKPTPGAPWHPGPHGHALRGKILAYNYLVILEEALMQAIDLCDDTEAMETYLKAQKKEEASHPIEMRKPLACHEEVCGTPAQCAVTYVPRAGPTLLDYVISPKDISKGTESAENIKWHVELSAADVSAVRAAEANGLGYLDYKYTLQGDSRAGPIEFEIEMTKEDGLIFLCEPPPVWGRQPEGKESLMVGTEVQVDGRPVGFADQKWHEDRWVSSDACKALDGKFPPGKHKVTVTPILEDKYVSISALIWF